MSKIKAVQCECGEVTGVRCTWSGTESDTVVVEYMPMHLRASHRAAGNAGLYPHNGATRLRVESETCARMLTHPWIDGEQSKDQDPWVTIVA